MLRRWLPSGGRPSSFTMMVRSFAYEIGGTLGAIHPLPPQRGGLE